MKDINKLKKLPLWELLTDEEKELIEKNIHNTTFKKGELIPKKSESCFGIILVKKGSLRVHIISEDGREVTLYRIKEGEMCTLSSSCVLDAITFEVHIEAEENTEIINVPSNIFKRIMEENIYVKAFMYEGIAARFSDVMWIMQQILFAGIDNRIAVFLIKESEEIGKDKIKITHEQLAKYIGSAREVVSRMLKYFEQEGFVSLGRGSIEIVDKNELVKIAR